MKLTAEIHCHTVYSHGSGTIEDNVLAAREKGIKKIIISEHGPGHMVAKHNTNETYKKMKNEIISLREKYPDMEIIMGLEANIISTKGELDVDDELLNIVEVLYCGIHLMSIPKNLSALFNLQLMNTLYCKFGIFKKRQTKINTNAIINAMRKYPLKMITHPDTRGPVDIIKIAKEAQKHNIMLEINDTQSKLNSEDIKSIEKEGINVMYAVGSDAHSKNDIGKWNNAKKIIEQSSISLEKIWNVE